MKTINTFSSPLLYRERENLCFVHDTYRDFFLAKYFANKINGEELTVPEAYNKYWSYEESALEGLRMFDLERWKSVFTFFPELLESEPAENIVNLLFDTFFGSYSRMFMLVMPERLKTPGNHSERERDFRNNPLNGFEKWGNLRDLIDWHQDINYDFKKKRMDYLKTVADLTTKFVVECFLGEGPVAQNLTNLLVLVDYPTIIDYSILAKMECLDPEKTRQLVEYNIEDLETAWEEELKILEQPSMPEEEENYTKRRASRYYHDAEKMRLLTKVIAAESMFDKRLFSVGESEYRAKKSKYGLI